MEELELIKRLRGGDNEAFRCIINAYQKMVINCAYKFLRDEESARDLTQEVFAEVYESINYFRAESKLSTWIYRITVTKAINQVKLINRKKQYAALVSFFADDSVMQKAQASENHNPEFEIERQDKAEILNSALAKLPENQRVAFTLCKVSELSYSEIAEIMNTSVSAIESLIHRAKTRLREKLYQYYTKHL